MEGQRCLPPFFVVRRACGLLRGYVLSSAEQGYSDSPDHELGLGVCAHTHVDDLLGFNIHSHSPQYNSLHGMSCMPVNTGLLQAFAPTWDLGTTFVATVYRVEGLEMNAWWGILKAWIMKKAHLPKNVSPDDYFFVLAIVAWE
jgi:hypothetical protein